MPLLPVATASGPIVVKNDNQGISNLNITTTSGVGIDTNGHSGVQIKNVTIITADRILASM